MYAFPVGSGLLEDLLLCFASANWILDSFGGVTDSVRLAKAKIGWVCQGAHHENSAFVGIIAGLHARFYGWNPLEVTNY